MRRWIAGLVLALLSAGASGQGFRECAECPEMVALPAGRFIMGVPPGEEAREDLPARISTWSEPMAEIAIGPGLAIGRFHVLRGEYAAFVAATGHAGGPCDGDTPGLDWRNPGFPQTDRHPVVCVNLSDAAAYATWLSRRTGRRYDLPSEAQWEYAARAGTATARFWGDGRAEACAHANAADRTLRDSEPEPGDTTRYFACADGHAATAPAGSFRANGFGLHDMLGNAWQWTRDCWQPHLRDMPRDGAPRMGGDCAQHAVRGGAWNYSPRYIRSGFRYGDAVTDRATSNGFRVIRLP